MEFENSVGLCLGNHYRLWDAKLVVANRDKFYL